MKGCYIHLNCRLICVSESVKGTNKINEMIKRPSNKLITPRLGGSNAKYSQEYIK